jgi:hypothetical protein
VLLLSVVEAVASLDTMVVVLVPVDSDGEIIFQLLQEVHTQL